MGVHYMHMHGLSSARTSPDDSRLKRPISAVRRSGRSWSHGIRAYDPSFGGRHLPATMDKYSFGPHEWYGHRQERGWQLAGKNRLQGFQTTSTVQLLRARASGLLSKPLAH